MLPKHGSHALSNSPVHKAAVMYPIEEICVLGKLLSGMIKSDVSHEFDINELIYTHMYVCNMCVCVYM